MPKETIQFKTKTGTVKIVRNAQIAIITIERISLGFKEKTVTEITKLDDDCIHYAFSSEKNIIATFKNQ